MKPIETLYFISPICVAFMVPMALLLEISTVLECNSFIILLQHPHLFLASGFAGFGVNLTSYLLVKRTSSMTLKTMTMTRNGALVLFSAVALGETVTWLETIGYGGLLVFFTLYTRVKMAEASARKGVLISRAEPTSLKPVPRGRCGATPHPPRDVPAALSDDSNTDEFTVIGAPRQSAESVRPVAARKPQGCSDKDPDLPRAQEHQGEQTSFAGKPPELAQQYA